MVIVAPSPPPGRCRDEGDHRSSVVRGVRDVRAASRRGCGAGRVELDQRPARTRCPRSPLIPPEHRREVAPHASPYARGGAVHRAGAAASGQERRSGRHPRAIAFVTRGRRHHRAGHVEKETTMAATKTTASTTAAATGSAPQERAAMKERAAELRAEGKKGAKKADGQQALLEAIAKMAPDDRALAERVHVAITRPTPPSSSRRPGTACRPGPTPRARSWCSSRTRGSSSTGSRPWASRTPRTSTTATSGRRPTRMLKWSPTVEKQVVALVKAAIS